MLEGFPVRNDGRGVTARTWCVPAAALLDGRGRPPHSPCPRLPSCTFAPSQRAVGRLTPGRAWCRRSERWRGCSGRLGPSVRHARGRCGGTQSALRCAVGQRLHASSACTRRRAGRGAREPWARSTALGGRRRRSPPRPPRAPCTVWSCGRWCGCSSRLSTWPSPATCLLLFPGVRCMTRDGGQVPNEQ